MAQGERVITAVPGEEGGITLHVRHVEHTLEGVDAMLVEQGPAGLLKRRHVTFSSLGIPVSSDCSASVSHGRQHGMSCPESTIPIWRAEQWAKITSSRPSSKTGSPRRELHLPRLGQERRPL